MLDGTHFFECVCHANEHTIRFTLDKEDNEIFVSIYLCQFRPWWERIWIALQYIVGINRCGYGHFCNWCLKPEDIGRMRAMLEELKPPV